MGTGATLALSLLAIETSTEACSVALWIDGRVSERYEVAPRRHTELVLPWAGELLAEAGIVKSSLDAIAVARGPGAFTGVRLAVALAQGMALALDKPVLAISTLQALALQCAEAPPVREGGVLVLAAIDARMGELYLGLFASDGAGGLPAQGEEWMATPGMPRLPGEQKIIGIGSGFAADSGALAGALGSRLIQCDPGGLPRAAQVATLAAAAFSRGEAIAADALEPAYLRNKVALTMAEQATARLAVLK